MECISARLSSNTISSVVFSSFSFGRQSVYGFSKDCSRNELLSFHFGGFRRREVRIFAHFGRVSRSRNSLRERLVGRRHDHSTEDAGHRNLLYQFDLWDSAHCEAERPPVCHNSDGTVKRVLVDDDEMIGGSHAQLWSARRQRFDDDGLVGANAKAAPTEIFATIGFFKQGDSFPRAGVVVLCGWLAFSAITRCLTACKPMRELTSEDREMLRRKARSRMKKDHQDSSKPQVVTNNSDSSTSPAERPQLDRHKLMESLSREMASNEVLVGSNLASNLPEDDTSFSPKVLEIRELAKQARISERSGSPQSVEDDQNVQVEPADISGNMSEETSHEIASPPPPQSCINIAKTQYTRSHEVTFLTDTVNSNCQNSKNMSLAESVQHEESAIDVSAARDKDSSCSAGTGEGAPLCDSGSTIAQCSPYTKLKTLRSEGEARTLFSQGLKSTVEKENSDCALAKCVKKPPRKASHVTTDGQHPSKFVNAERGTLAPGSSYLNGEDFDDASSSYEGHSNQKVAQSDLKYLRKMNCNQNGQMRLSSLNIPMTGNGRSSKTSTPEDTEKKNYNNVDSHLNCIEEKEKLVDIPSKDSCMADSMGHEGTPQFHENSSALNYNSSTVTPKIAGSVKDFGRHLSQECETLINKDNPDTRLLDCVEPSGKARQLEDEGKWLSKYNKLGRETSSSENFDVTRQGCRNRLTRYDGSEPSASGDDTKSDSNQSSRDMNTEDHFPDIYADNGYSEDMKPHTVKQSWPQENFEDFDPIVKKIEAGFKENYMMARAKAQEEGNLCSNLSSLRIAEDNDELEWVKDDVLRTIVLRVRENELAGRNPFHEMNIEEKQAFFEGLEKKVEKANQKLANLHTFIHSNIENLDYGADGISIYDSPDKFIPRWKGPPIWEQSPYLSQTHLSPEKSPISRPENRRLRSGNQSSSEYRSENSRTVIEHSDGSSKAGLKKGKEQWEHTKKWSQEFVAVYNAETDPETKSIMKDIGKDLDRWITKKEVEDAEELMSHIPRKRREHIKKKMERLKRETEMYGLQAVVSKYQEYGVEKKADHLWWLDLPFVLCIELYRIENDVPKVGFYSLEMGQSLELDPKPCHVIAFEDNRDARNFCYIIQAHLDLLGNGRAFIVPRSSKDIFREARGSGFCVTVIRKGKLKLNVDYMLEDVEAKIVEIGSKIYYEKIMREKSVDAGALLRGLLLAERSV